MNLPTLDKFNVKGKTVLLRIDINSPVVNGKVLDNPRFEASSKTIRYLLKNNAKITIIAHQGRKDSKDFLPLQQHARILSKYTKHNVRYISDLFGDKAKKEINDLKAGESIILKNVREYEDEINIKSKNNRYIKFCKLFDFYVNEAFSVSHREQGSIILPPRYLKSAAGLEFESEIKTLEKFKNKNKRSVFILGGSKVEDYFSLFNFLKNKNNKILAAGVLANLFLIAKGYDLGYENKWIKDNNYIKLVPKLKLIYNKYRNQIFLPIDFGLFGDNGRRLDKNLKQIPFKYKIYDIGKETLALFKQKLNNIDYIFMKGPLGFSEIPEFSYPTVDILKYIAILTKREKIFSLIGGGHLTTTIKNYNIPKNFSYVSLSGGALIKYISGEKLPGIAALTK